MTEFWIVAALMTVIAIAFIAFPIWRTREKSGRWPVAAVVAAALLAPASVLLYRSVTTWSGAATAMVATDDQLAIVEQLAAKMQQNPEDVEGWMLLGRSYLTLQQFPKARAAFEQAWQRTPSPGNDLKLGLGIAMIHSDRASIGGGGGQLVEEVLAADPRNQQALWYGGMVAYDRGRTDLARDRWTRLLALGPPPEIARVIEQQIAMLGAGTPPIDAASDAPPAVTRQATPSSAAGSAADGPTIPIRVSLGDGISTEHLGPNAALFIFARAQVGGPPVAVIRESVAAIPGVFVLSNARTMMGNRLENFEQLTLVARLSASGQPTESPGDIYAQSTYDVAAGGEVQLTLDQIAR